MRKLISWLVCLFVLIFISTGDLFAQQNEIFNFVVEKNCASTIEKFRSKFGVLVAYNPDLAQIQNPESRTIKGRSAEEIFSKICLIFNLDYIPADKASFLVRSDFNSTSQSNETIVHINIAEQRDGYPISYATVYDESKKYFAFTDEFGDCFIRLPKSKVGTMLRVHSLAHSETTIQVTSDNKIHKIVLADDPVKVIPLTISSLKKRLNFMKGQGASASSGFLNALTGASVFPTDVLKSVQLMPGVSNTDDSRSSIRIRGANDEATLLLLDEMPVYKADHFYGIFSSFNSRYINELTLLKNNIPVEYGGRTSGMLKMKSNAKIDSFDIVADVNLLSTGIAINLPLSKSLSVSMAGRKSYTDLFSTTFAKLQDKDSLSVETRNNGLQNVIISKPRFDFWDFNGKISFNAGKHQFSLNSFISKDVFDNQYFISILQPNRPATDENFSQYNDWENKSFGLSHVYNSKKVAISTNFYTTRYYSGYDVFSDVLRFDPMETIRDSAHIFNTNSIEDNGVKISARIPGWHNALLGAEHIRHFNYLNIENDQQSIFKVDKSGNETSLFASLDLGKSTTWQVMPSIRYNYLHYLAEGYFLPQIHATYNIQTGLKAKASAGRHLQNVRLFEHENVLGQKQQFFVLANGSNVPVGIGQNLMLGATWSKNNFTIDIEGFYRTLDGAVNHATSAPGLRPPKGNKPNPTTSFRLFQGESRVQGVDFTLVYDSKNLVSMLTYTLSKAENRFPEIFSNQYFPSSDDSRHQLKFFNAYSFKKVEFTLTYSGATGRPYLDLSNLDRMIDRRNLNLNKYIQKLSDYHRIDLSASYKMNFKHWHTQIGFTVFNLFDRVNVKYRQFIYQLPPGQGSNSQQNTIVGSDISQLERTYNLTFSFGWK